MPEYIPMLTGVDREPACEQCKGCGSIADDGKGTPWVDHISENPRDDITVRKDCPGCLRTGIAGRGAVDYGGKTNADNPVLHTQRVVVVYEKKSSGG